jgi:site-specific DNA-cytosine methylase
MLNLELFSCSGGMAEGFRRAGINFDYVFDYDADACDSYDHNLGHRPIQMDVRDLLRMVRTGWRPGAIGLLVADPPCTPWSRAGKRLGTEDERDMLEDTADLIRLLRPRAYLIGNVPGLQDETTWHVVQRVIGGLQKHGYCVADYAQLDAADYGVPQHRIRPFWFGHLDGPCVRWPTPTHGDPANPALPGLELEPWITCRQALQHLPLAELGRPVRMKIRAARDEGGKGGGDRTRCSAPDKVARTVVAGEARKGGQILIPPVSLATEPKPNHPVSRLDEPSFTIKCNGGRASQAASMLSLRNPAERRPPETGATPTRTVTTQSHANHLIGWPWERPSTTVCMRDTIPPPGHHPESGSILSMPNAVVLSEKAATILQGFPETWRFSGATKRARWAQLGMAMPPPLAEAVARSIAAALKKNDILAG